MLSKMEDNSLEIAINDDVRCNAINKPTLSRKVKKMAFQKIPKYAGKFNKWSQTEKGGVLATYRSDAPAESGRMT